MGNGKYKVLYTLRPRQNGHRFSDGIFKLSFVNENALISIQILLKFVLRGAINNIPILVEAMAWHQLGDSASMS